MNISKKNFGLLANYLSKEPGNHLRLDKNTLIFSVKDNAVIGVSLLNGDIFFGTDDYEAFERNCRKYNVDIDICESSGKPRLLSIPCEEEVID